MTITRVRSLWKKLIPYAAAVAVLGAGGAAVAQRYLGDCCAEGAACCKPGAACCKGKTHAAVVEN
jgi:hypothetical protein